MGGETKEVLEGGVLDWGGGVEGISKILRFDKGPWLSACLAYDIRW